ncbi:MAG: hypothetical protein H7279_12130 [Microbacteriaceae bacterium]|nr:hypothetical protein [Microbacteriaceae bacterium]
MSAHTSSGIILSDLGLAWPDGASAPAAPPRHPRGIPAAFPRHSSGNARLNSSGESMPLKLIGVRAQVDVLRALEGGNTSAGRFVALAERWDVETKAADPLR